MGGFEGVGDEEVVAAGGLFGIEELYMGFGFNLVLLLR